ncbi:unnamed protein product [Rotaria magnacalcarata]|uniref:Reverse transcriptase domain-containing protein n=1 Tax=Rotaria magnacalcarata TaxID=392030 RepID=A0A816PV58_9BILA|nr:unnamed protein product [Rotaria magnacalcarata]
MVQLLYEDTSAQIRLDDDVNESFVMNTGVRQGCILSPIVFNIYIDYIMKQVIQQANVQGVTLSYRLSDFWLTVKGYGSHKVHILTLMYADDIVVMCDSPKNLEHFIKVKCISIQAKVRVFKACILPVLVYGSEIWCLKAAEEQRLNTFYMKCLRTLLGVDRGDRMRNDLILALTGQSSLEKILRRNRLRWFGHVNRMNNEADQPILSKKVLFSFFADAQKPPHGVKLRWKDKIAKDFTICEIKSWRREVQDKEMCRKTINKEVKLTTVRSDAAHVIHVHKERAKKRRADERFLDCNKNMNNPPSTPTIINVDTTCSLCGRTFKSKRGMNIHKRVCIQKRSTTSSADTKTNVMHQRMTASTTTKNTTTQDIKIKIKNLLTQKDKNKNMSK